MQDLSGLYISQSFQNLVQRSASGAFNVLGTATGTEFIPVSASYAISSSHAVDADTTISSSYAVSSSHAINADSAISASYATFAQEAENAVRSTKLQIPAIAKETLTKGDPVYISGYNLGQSKPEVSRAEADDAATMPAIGLILTNAVNNDDIEVIITGDFLNIDTVTGLTNPAVGDTVYVDVGGGFTNVKPTGTNLIQNVGIIGRVQQNNGEIVVSCIQRTNDLPNIQEDYLWLGDANGVPQAVISSSIVVDNAVSSSYALTASYLEGAVDAFPYTGSAQITGSLGVTGSMIVSRNEPGVNATLVIRDDAQSSFNDGPTLTFEGSNVGIIQSQANTNMQIKVERDLEIFVGGGAGSQFKIDKTDNQGGDYTILDRGSRSARYQHENLSETGSIKFKHNGFDNGIAIEMNDNRMALEMYSGSAFVPIIERKVATREINLYDSTFSTGSSGQVLSSNAQGGIEWAAGGGGGAAFPFTGSAQITGSLAVTGSTTIRGPLSSGGANGTNTLAAGAAAALGSNNTVNNTDAAIVGGSGHTVSGDTSVIMGGESNNVNSSFSGIFGAASSTITNADTSVILGGYQQSLQGARTYLLGGNQNSISNSGAEFSGIIGGQSNTISTAITASAIIGGKNITATKNETVYVPNLEVVNGGIRIPAGGGTTNPGLVITGSALNNVVTEAVVSNTASIQLNESNTFEFTAGAANTHVVTTNIAKGQVINIKVTQDAGGAGTLTFDPEFKFPGGTAPTLTAVAGAIDIISCISYDGTTLLSNATQNYS